MHLFLLKQNTYEVILVNVHNNNFIGTLPSNIFLLPSLEYVDISSNRVTGGLPNEFIALNSMKTCEYIIYQPLSVFNFHLYYFFSGFVRSPVEWNNSISSLKFISS